MHSWKIILRRLHIWILLISNAFHLHLLIIHFPSLFHLFHLHPKNICLSMNRRFSLIYQLVEAYCPNRMSDDGDLQGAKNPSQITLSWVWHGPNILESAVESDVVVHIVWNGSSSKHYIVTGVSRGATGTIAVTDIMFIRDWVSWVKK